MATAVVRKPVSFRLNAALLEELKRKAASANRSLNNYVESVLLDDVYNEPNEETRAAIEEVKSGRNPNKVYRNVDEMFNDILNEE
ncbi:MAG: toxin-antitoxin system protein [Bacteroidaceae bacterium]|nr:toxin-antitoxin system protein [Bacteroidaceae bacterium]